MPLIDLKKQRKDSQVPSLSPRLAMVEGLLPHAERLIDIGTDHAYLPIAAIRDGLCQRAIAADIRPGPLAIAARNIRRYGLEKNLSTVLSDGLAAFSCQPGDVVVMAGLGGLEMIDILEQAPHQWPTLVLQPQKSAPFLRRYLARSGYSLTREALCMDDRRLYLGLVAQVMDHLEIEDLVSHYIGPCLMKDKPALYRHWLEKVKVQVRHAIRRGEDLSDVMAAIEYELAAMDITREERAQP